MILHIKRFIYTAARQSGPGPNQARVLVGVELESYKSRHIGPRSQDVAFMLSRIGFPSLDSMMKTLLPNKLSNVASRALGIKLPKPISESKMLSIASHYASMNRISKSYVGNGYHDVKTPSIIQRAVLENPAWYNPYTPYQAEISQGRLEALFTFQTMIAELAGLPIVNASLLDEATAAAEAMMMLYSSNERKKQTFLVDRNVYPQTIEVLWSRGEPLGVNLKCIDDPSDIASDKAFGMLVQYPNRLGSLRDSVELIESARGMGIKVVTAVDPLALAILKSPGELGADASVGTTQRFGIPMGYGGPHAAYIAAKTEYKRLMPGRMVGETHDVQGNRGYRLALQTREQHIRRDKATSNICTAQALLANMAAFYAIYLGPHGLRDAAKRVHEQTRLLGEACMKYGHHLVNDSFFDTISFIPGNGMNARDLHRIAESYGVLLGSPTSNVISISTHQDCDEDAILTLLKIIQGMPAGTTHSEESTAIFDEGAGKLSPTTKYFRGDQFLKQKVFNSYHSETELLRFIYQLQKKDMTLADSMIPLGSCSMKSNGVSMLSPLSWPSLNGIHPFSPPAHSAGSQKIIGDLEEYLCQITGFSAFSFQPNSGAQGEFAGLKVIQAYQQCGPSTTKRDVCLIPVSAHGTNPASAAMAGFKVVSLGCDNDGSINMEGLEQSIASFGPRIACIMLTYPSTYGVFDSNVLKITEMVHSVGGLVYLDGANMNAMLGHLRPADLGADVGHLNLHKTFCIPHGGGGPGMGPIGVTSKLAPFLPSHHTLPPTNTPDLRTLPVSAAPFGSASLLVIPWAYIRLMGLAGLKECTEVAVLNANYVMRGLEREYKILNSNGLCGHEFIIDCRPFRETAGVTVGDIAKRLQDYSIHSPTVSWPVAGALIVEPTESEGLGELDRFIEAMVSVRSEIGKIENGQYPRDNNPLKNAPHPQSVVMASEWRYPYSREEAAFPIPGLWHRKSWPTLGRLDEAFGDQNFCCTLS